MGSRASSAGSVTRAAGKGRAGEPGSRRFTAPLRRLVLRSEEHRVWFLTILLTALAVAGYASIVSKLKEFPSPVHLPWPLLALGFFAAESKVLVIHLRRESHSFSLSEIVIVFGLFFASPNEYVFAQLLGSGLAFVLIARQSIVKVAFNLSNSALTAIVMLIVFRAIAVSNGPPDLDDWFAAFAASLTVSVMLAVTIATAISLSGGASQFQKLPEMLRFGGMVAVANTSLGLLAVSIMWDRPLSMWLLVVPLIVLFLAYEAYVAEREKHEALELLYQSSRILQHSPELDLALVALLEHARDMFRAEVAEVVLYTGGVEADAVRTTSLQGEQAEVMAPLALVVDQLRGRTIREHRSFHYVPTSPMERGGRMIGHAIVSPLVGDSGLIGEMMVANRITDGTSFDDDDLRLLGTIANQTAVALENGQLEQSLAELSRLKEQLRFQAYHDPLTGLANRVMFAEAVDDRLAGLPLGSVCAVLFLDLDDFKLVNDSLGHAAGDALLAAVAERIKGCIRSDDLAARLGGDEFAILLLDEDSMERATMVATRIIDALAATVPVQGQDLFVGASIGIAVGRADQKSDDLLRDADVAMYTAKSAGKRRIAVFDPTMHAAIVARHGLSAELSRAVGRGELAVHYQPIVDLETGRIAGTEALVRWHHPTRGLTLPDEFIPLAEENGVILALGRWVLAEACRQAAVWLRHPETRPDFSVSVNLSPLQVQQPDFIEEVEGILASTGLAPQRLILELTETAMFLDARSAVGKLQELRSRGVRIAIDDFGTGYSSLGSLRRFPVDILKIARDFVVSTESDPSEWAFAHAIVALGRTLGLEIIAEGIEETGQVERLLDLGCRLGQGFQFSRAVEPHELSALLGLPAEGGTASPTPAKPAGERRAARRAARKGDAAPAAADLPAGAAADPAPKAGAAEALV